MSDPSLPLQKAIYDALHGETNAGANVFDNVDPSNPFPRITIGSGDSSPVNEAADPNCNYWPFEVFPQIDVWSIATGYPQAKAIASEIHSILHGETLTLEGFTMEEPLVVQSSVPSRDQASGITGVRMTFRTRIAEDTSP